MAAASFAFLPLRLRIVPQQVLKLPAIGKSNTGLRDAIQKALQSLMDDGTYKTIIDHYGLQPYPKADVNGSTDPGSGS